MSGYFTCCHQNFKISSLLIISVCSESDIALKELIGFLFPRRSSVQCHAIGGTNCSSGQYSLRNWQNWYKMSLRIFKVERSDLFFNVAILLQPVWLRSSSEQNTCFTNIEKVCRKGLILNHYLGTGHCLHVSKIHSWPLQDGSHPACYKPINCFSAEQ